tara:strand:- start:2416 stop:3036 length:621 start_codon:yes stop_codon:yes gene_type:complete
MDTSQTNALHFPATSRNRDAIAEVLDTFLPASGTVLEIGSGSGEHIVYFAKRFKKLRWQPSDPDSSHRRSIEAWIHAGSIIHKNILPPISIDISDSNLPSLRADIIICINVIHISPWQTTQGLFRNAVKLLPKGGNLYLYGPYKINGKHTAPSNQAFDRSLQERNRLWGVRELEEVIEEANLNGLNLIKTIEMPANNQSIIFCKPD